ncbi:hypothetical protein ACIBQ6_22150 [Nonomuraea sp. NPDC049655]|uniref:hypothetical protein n=1 Tax=Nonomuraea sp. NPDC049655 TaxID=3364355 RepID=UPI0037A70DA8
MSTLKIRDPYGNTFEIDAYARPYWENREGYAILPDEREDAERQPDKSDTPKTTSKAGSRPAQNTEE